MKDQSLVGTAVRPQRPVDLDKADALMATFDEVLATEGFDAAMVVAREASALRAPWMNGVKA